ncbi:MAG: hypothetical protein QOD06_148 [Candidatus Binatota bacterium]|jgi:4-amino-4-deoxy-L-arabinose transferase-like glycosyltransferase|nr:hypothetical protein [Candidatus Binatota bacterium]
MLSERRSVWALALLAFCLFLYVWRLGEIPFYTKGEPREAVQVWEEVHSGEWVLPLRNGRELPSKPPLFHWIGGVTALITGTVDEFAVRFPSALLATLAVLLTFWLGSEKWGVLAGVYAGFIVATNFEWFRAATTARVDMTLTAFLTAAFVALDRVVSAPFSPPPGALLGFYVSMGLAALAKGPVGIVLPMLTAVVYLAITRDLARLRRMHLFAGGAIAGGIAVAWYVLAYLQGGESFVYKHLWVENVGRFFAAGESGAGHEHPFYYLVPAFVLNFAPWSFFLVPLGIFLNRIRDRLVTGGYAYELVWFATVLVFYSVSQSKRSVYLLPAYPAAALLLGAWWQHLTNEAFAMPRTVIEALHWTGVFLAAATVVLIGVLLAEGYGAEPLAILRPLLSPKDQANLPFVHEIIQSRFSVVSLWILALVPVLLLFLLSVRRRRWTLVFASLVAFFASITSVVNGVFHPALAWRLTYKPFFEVVRGTVQPDDQIYFYKTFDYGAVFYSRRHIPPIKDPTEPASSAERRTYVLMRSRTWERLPEERRARLRYLHESDGGGPKGDSRLVFALVKSEEPAPASSAGSELDDDQNG